MTEAYSESRSHEIRRRRLQMIDGNLVANLSNTECGRSERVYEHGYWGFASAGGANNSGSAERLRDEAAAKPRTISWFGPRAAQALSAESHRGTHAYTGKPELSQRECVDRLAAMHAWCRERFKSLKSTQLLMMDEHHTKHLRNSAGSDAGNSIQRAPCYITLAVEGEDGAPVELMERVSGKGSIADLELSLDVLGPKLDRLHEHLKNKRRAVPAVVGQHTVFMGPDLAGILAHEAMGHPCEADIVLGGAVTGDMLGQRVGSELIGMVDYAHHIDGREALVPVYVDD